MWRSFQHRLLGFDLTIDQSVRTVEKHWIKIRRPFDVNSNGEISVLAYLPNEQYARQEWCVLVSLNEQIVCSPEFVHFINTSAREKKKNYEIIFSQTQTWACRRYYSRIRQEPGVCSNWWSILWPMWHSNVFLAQWNFYRSLQRTN